MTRRFHPAMSTGRLLAALAPAFVLTVPLAGCLKPAQPDADLASRQFQTDANPLPTHFSAPGSDGPAAAPSEPLTQPLTPWVAEFNDPILTGLVNEALANNPSLKQAAAAWEQAQLRIQTAQAQLQPSLDLQAQSTRRKQMQGSNASTETTHSVEGVASWELDLWGKLRSDRFAAEQSAEAARLEYVAAQQSLAAAVADTWLLTIQAKLQLAVDEDQLQAELQTDRITEDKAESGAGLPLDDQLTEANVALARDAVRRDQAALAEMTQSLETLLGRYPKAELAITNHLPVLADAAPTGVPSQLLERRPDILAADRRVAASFHLVESAKAARLPQVTLSASLGSTFDPTEAIWSIGGGIFAPLFDGGRLKTEVDLATVAQKQAMAAYVETVLAAFGEVEQTLVQEQALAERQTHLANASKQLRQASRIGSDRYEAGIMSIVDLMTIRRQDFAARTQLVEVEVRRLRNRLALHRALGGPPTPGSQDTPAPGSNASEDGASIEAASSEHAASQGTETN